ncbi:unnamed protein product [Lota lota]
MAGVTAGVAARSSKEATTPQRDRHHVSSPRPKPKSKQCARIHPKGDEGSEARERERPGTFRDEVGISHGGQHERDDTECRIDEAGRPFRGTGH